MQKRLYGSDSVVEVKFQKSEISASEFLSSVVSANGQIIMSGEGQFHVDVLVGFKSPESAQKFLGE